MPVFADGNSVNGVRSLETQTELLEYATNVFPKHLHALVEIGDLNGAVEEYSLATFMGLRIVDYFMQSISATTISIIIVSFVFALFGVSDFNNKRKG